MKGLVVIPVYNEESTLPDIIGAFRTRIPSYRFLYVDDGSCDHSTAILERAGVSYLRHPFNLGYNAALQTGMQYALAQGFDFVVFFDADGQHRIEDLDAIMSLGAKGNSDLVIGSRYLEHPTQLWSLRSLVNRTLAKIVMLWTGQKVTDSTSGLKLITRDFIELALRIPTEDMGAELLMALIRHGARVREVPIQVAERKFGTSMHHTWKAVLYPLKTLLCLMIALLPWNCFPAQRRKASSIPMCRDHDV